MSDYTGPERRNLDPSHPASVEPVQHVQGETRQWRVRAGMTWFTVSDHSAAYDHVFRHNYMHGHLVLPVDDVPAPADRRDPAPASFDSTMRTAIDALTHASHIEADRGGHYRAADLHTLARSAQEVLNA